MSSPASMPPPSMAPPAQQQQAPQNPADASTSLSALDDEQFRARLKPTLFGLPPVAIAGLGIVAFCIAFLILWFLFA